MSGSPVAALKQLRDAYVDRLSAARAFHAAAGKVVGIVGPTVPIELILAIDAFPLQLAAEPPHPTPTADRLIEQTEPWPMRSVADRALDGTYEFLDLMVITRAEEWLYYNLKEAQRIGEGARVPPLHIHDLIQNHGAAVAGYNKAQTDMLIDRLQRLHGGPVEAHKLSAAIDLTNRRRGLMRRLIARRDAGGLSGVDAMPLLGAAQFLHPEAYCGLLARALDAMPAVPLADGPAIVVVTSEPLFHTELHRLLEGLGARVIAEDSWWGSRAPGDDIPTQGDPFANVRHASVVNTQGEDVQPREAREAWIRARIERGDLKGAIFYLPADKRFGWGVPRLSARMHELGMATVILQDDVLQPAGKARIETAAAAFIASLRIRQGAPA